MTDEIDQGKGNKFRMMRTNIGYAIKRLLKELLKVAYWRYERRINTSSNFKILGLKLSADWLRANPIRKYDLNREFGF